MSHKAPLSFRLALSATITAIRTSSGMSMPACAAAAGIHHSGLYRAEAAEMMPSVATLKALATACGRSLTVASRVIELVEGQAPQKLDKARNLATVALAQVTSSQGKVAA